MLSKTCFSKYFIPLQCSNADNEPMVALVVGGRHPGHYFLDSDDFNDVVTRLFSWSPL